MIPDLSVAWIVFFVLLLTILLNSLFFKPLLRVMKERETAIQSARELAEQAAARSAAAVAELDGKINAARSELYREIDEKRRAALEQRAALLAATRQETQAELETARRSLEADVTAARARLRLDAEDLGAEVAGRVIGRHLS